MTTPVNFSIAKLLKEKGFGKWTGDIKTTNYCLAKYFHRRPKGYGLVNWKETDVLYISGYDNWVTEYPYCEIWTYAPTIAEVVMWLYEKHDLLISVYSDKCLNWKRLFSIRIDWLYPQDSPDLDVIELENFKYKGKNEFNSPVKAYEAAIKYVTKNLI